MNEQEWDQAKQKQRSALEVLGPLGFVDNNDDEFPGEIYHQASGVVIDCLRVTPGEIIAFVFKEGERQGEQKARRAIRQAIGL
jgi:hypothetical protein